MMYLNKLDEQGHFELIDEAFLALYSVPESHLVALSDEQYQDYLNRGDSNTRFVNGEFVFAEKKQDIDKIPQQKAQLIQALMSKTDKLKSQILAGYPQTEIDSFYRQEQEARKWKENNESPTPMLSAIAENRGVPFAILVGKVIEKADLLASQMGNLLGQKQAFEDRLNSADTPEKLTQLQEEIEQWTI